MVMCGFKAKAGSAVAPAGCAWGGNGLAPGAYTTMGTSWLGDLRQTT